MPKTDTLHYAEHVRHALGSRYTALTLQEEGLNGLVFSARRLTAPERPLMLKVAYPSDSGGMVSDSVMRFRREAEIGARLSHPHIVGCSPIETLHGLEFCEMEFAGVVRLDQLITTDGGLRWARATEILREIAAALDYAHARGIVHGALRPSAVWLNASGEVQLSGFVLYDNSPSPNGALLPSAVGDPAYMPPEQWHSATVSPGVDIYALGLIAYEMATGHARVASTVPGIAEIEPVELPLHRPLGQDVPPHVAPAIRRAANRDPGLRYATAERFIDALIHPAIATGHTLPTRRPSTARRWHPPSVLIVLAVLVAALLLLGATPVIREHLLSLMTGRPLLP